MERMKLQPQMRSPMMRSNALAWAQEDVDQASLWRQKGQDHALAWAQQDPYAHAHVSVVAAASAAAAEAAVAAAQAAAEIMRLTFTNYEEDCIEEDSVQEKAAIFIQAVYRGHLARQALRALKSLVKLQAVVRGYLVRRQAQISLRCMEALVRLQTRVRARQLKATLENIGKIKDAESERGKKVPGMVANQRISHIDKEGPLPMRQRSTITVHANPALEVGPPSHRLPMMAAQTQSSQSKQATSPALAESQNVMNFAKDKLLDASFGTSSVKSGADEMKEWDGTPHTKEEIEARVLRRQHATAMRQKALTYAEMQQQRATKEASSSSKGDDRPEQGLNQGYRHLSFTETEPDKLHRDWTWLEGWMAAQGPTLWEYNMPSSQLATTGGCEIASCNADTPIDFDDNTIDIVTRPISYGSVHEEDDGPGLKIIEMDRIASPASHQQVRIKPRSNTLVRSKSMKNTSTAQNGHARRFSTGSSSRCSVQTVRRPLAGRPMN